MRALAASLLLVGCAHAPAPVALSIVVRGDDAAATETRRAIESAPLAGITKTMLDVRATADGTPSQSDDALDRARAAYDEPSFPKCLAAVGDPSLVSNALGRGDRERASKLLFWKTACLVLRGDEAGALASARALATYELDVPAERADPAVARLLVSTVMETSKAPRATVNVSSAGPELLVTFDGRRACTTPCAISAARGLHVVHVEGDDVTPVDREVAVDAAAATEARFDPPRATPDLAQKQWLERYASTPAIDGAASLHLLADATRTRNLALVVARGGAHPSLRGALVIDGLVRARAEKDGAKPADASVLLHDLLVEGRVIERTSLIERPLFWIAIVAAAGLAAGVTYALATLPHTAEIHFK